MSTKPELCDGAVADVFYGNNVKFAAGWWCRCDRCGSYVALRGDGEDEWPDVHPVGGWQSTER